MKTRLTAALILSLCAFGSAHAADIKPGLWEFKSKLAMPGMPDMSAQMEMMQQQMKNLPPEARAMMEKQMAAQGVAMGSGGALQVCITPEDAKGANVYTGKTDGDCRYTNVTNSATRVKGTITCTKPKASGDFEAIIDSPTHFTSKVNMQSAEGTMNADTDARWLADDCGKIKPTAR
ncbi:DUF3617 domain-containing protein [Methyloversatilis sp.]|uniref:DUF3617 domain-containing protein n=1 Tax=Methyloversatilis sp. TaxID=2569862 RepID=UPI0027372ACB|nr:DUF3617 domain-containing protein [Methyloversatilis sp.]MDP2868570.1 DUF3617 domain-containing protein [Methyloversatilis sp.]MDP3287972.1 DUF3617 domain-containing protein [Methyloversatilis sp.]MDP3457276.1 DUF3617 domain-containing protein [Methyloversatilis sp.]MDP3576668.1 DUF3617 domain-containing protein [Methyloversatilis sp.]